MLISYLNFLKNYVRYKHTFNLQGGRNLRRLKKNHISIHHFPYVA